MSHFVPALGQNSSFLVLDSCDDGLVSHFVCSNTGQHWSFLVLDSCVPYVQLFEKTSDERSQMEWKRDANVHKAAPVKSVFGRK